VVAVEPQNAGRAGCIIRRQAHRAPAAAHRATPPGERSGGSGGGHHCGPAPPAQGMSGGGRNRAQAVAVPAAVAAARVSGRCRQQRWQPRAGMNAFRRFGLRCRRTLAPWRITPLGDFDHRFDLWPGSSWPRHSSITVRPTSRSWAATLNKPKLAMARGTVSGPRATAANLVTDLVGSGTHAAELPQWCDSNQADLVLMQFGTNDVLERIRSPSADPRRLFHGPERFGAPANPKRDRDGSLRFTRRSTPRIVRPLAKSRVVRAQCPDPPLGLRARAAPASPRLGGRFCHGRRLAPPSYTVQFHVTPADGGAFPNVAGRAADSPPNGTTR